MQIIPFPASAVRRPASHTTVEQAVARFLEFRRLANLSVHTLDRYAQDFRLWTTWRIRQQHSPILTDVTLDELRAYFAYLRDEHRPHSTNPHRRTLDRVGLKPHTIAGHWKVLHAAWIFWIDEKLLTDCQQAFFMRGRVPSPKIGKEVRPTYDLEVFEDLLEACGMRDDALMQARDKAVLLTLFDSGMRVAELCGIDDEHVNLIERQALVTGKGGKQRYVFWTTRTAGALDAYLRLRPDGPDGRLFRAYGRGGRGGKTYGGMMNPGMVRDMVVRRAARIGITLPASAVHALRHTFAHRFLENGGDGLYLQQILGHESIVTTMRYVRENPKALRNVYGRIMGE